MTAPSPFQHLQGRWFVLDGVNAVGKTTQLDRVAACLEQAGLQVQRLPEMSDGPVGRLILQIIKEKRFYSLHPENKTPFADAYALLADLLYEVESTIVPAQAAGKVVLSDRGILSFCGYQGVRMHRWAKVPDAGALLLQRAKSAFMNLPIPDLHLHLTVDETEMQRRILQRGETLLKEEQLEFLREVVVEMTGLSKRLATQTVDTTGLSREDVTGAILLAMSEWRYGGEQRALLLDEPQEKTFKARL